MLETTARTLIEEGFRWIEPGGAVSFAFQGGAPLPPYGIQACDELQIIKSQFFQFPVLYPDQWDFAGRGVGGVFPTGGVPGGGFPGRL